VAVALVLVRQRRCLTVLALRTAMIRCVSWMEWLKALDWSHWDNVLSATVGVTVLVGIAWAAIKFVLNPLADWLGRRRAQAKRLDQLACGSSVEFVESLFGVAQFISSEDGRQQRTYRQPGAWVMIEIVDNYVYAFSITVTSRWLHYSTKRLTFGLLNVKLGKSKFGPSGVGYEGERLWIGARRSGYLRRYYFGNPGGYQYYWLSYNMSGVGVFSRGDTDSMFVETGPFCSDPESPNRYNYEPALDASGTTINTLTVLSPEGSVDQLTARHVLGPDEDRVRLASTIRPAGGTLRTWYYLKRYRLRQAFQKLKPKRQ